MPEEVNKNSIASQTINYPQARKDESQEEQLHGVELEDVDRWLEDADSEETNKYVDLQNEISQPFLENFEACKYWPVLETLQFPVIGAPKEINLSREKRLQFNLKKLQETIKLTPEDVIVCLINDLKLKHMQESQTNILGKPDNTFLYCLYSIKMILDICENVNFSTETREDLVSERHKSLIIACLEDVALFSLQTNLHEAFYKDKGAVFKRFSQVETNFYSLEFIVEVFAKVLFIKPLHIGTALEDVNLWYMAGIFSLFLALDNKQYHLEQIQLINLQAKLQKMGLELSQKLYFRNLMILYSTLPANHKQRIHREMLLRLWSPGGFMALLFAMVESQRNEEQPMEEMIARLVAQPTYSTKAQHSLIKQILQFLQASLKNKDLFTYIGAAILSLRKLYDNKMENRDLLHNWLKQQLLPLIEIKEDNLVAMEWTKFTDLISLLFHIFCTSSVASLPSDLLIVYLPVFMDIYSQLRCYSNQNALKSHLTSLILKILNNRSKDDLKNIIECLALQTYPAEWYRKHANINITENPLNIQELKLTQSENATNPIEEHLNPLTSLIVILKYSTYNLLIYQIFIILFQLVPSLVIDDISSDSAKEQPTKIDLLESEDLYNRVLIDISQKYEKKFEIIKSLEALAQHQPLKPLIHENISDLLKALQAILTTYTASIEQTTLTDINKSVLMILLILIREIIESCSSDLEEFQATLFKPLKQLEQHVQEQNLKYQITSLLKLIQGESKLSSHYDPMKNQFGEARSLIESKESYLQVEGLEKMIKLLNNRDEFAVSNWHVLIALSLNTLKSPESYTFLNCVRLFVALLNVKESEVLELLADEYLNEATSMDYRLVIGEATLKVSRELGPLCYKYKNVLLNTYMCGCRSPLDEFRFSSFSNLSQMCRILTFQVHNYFQELLHLINCELTTGKYLPAKRAAVMVLSDLLSGMDNLFDYEEMLLPIYRLLKFLVASEESDEKIRLHASNGLRCLAEKCKELFRAAAAQRPLEKEIQIMGIRDKPKRSLKQHILELN